jgi:GNAT superfamily N-acetyltransferase
MEVRWLRSGDGALLREVRLQALTDAPLAFAVTLDHDAQLPPAFWDARAAESEAGESGRVFVATSDEAAVGMAGGFFPDGDRATAILSGMWVSPTARRQGVARALVEAVADWARAHQAHTLELIVTQAPPPNPPALLYQTLGFTLTGETKPVDFDRSLTGVVMTLAL